ncbi:MAG: EcsC family protein, partial [Desulfovibrionaceae bacterium]|nr:EcsC family protein [Desulfovibrionaceae bacterium]
MTETAAAPDAREEKASILVRAVDWAFDRAVQGVPGTESAAELAERFRAMDLEPRERVAKLVRSQAFRTGATGFAVNLGGLAAMPVAIPADFASLMFVQMRMVAAIAMLSGVTDLHDSRVRLLCVACLAGEKILVPLKDMGIAMSVNAAHTAAAAVSQAAAGQVHAAVGATLLHKFGHAGAAHFGRALPLVGGVVGGGVNMAFTWCVGRAAEKL